MYAIKEYIFTVIAVSIIVSLVKSLSQFSGIGKQIRFLCGLILTMTFLQPLLRLSIPDLSEFRLPSASYDANPIIAGQVYFEESVSEIIKEQTESYILSKAAELGAMITVTIQMDWNNPPVPYSVYIGGEYTHEQKMTLTNMISNDIRITQENQIWN